MNLPGVRALRGGRARGDRRPVPAAASAAFSKMHFRKMHYNAEGIAIRIIMLLCEHSVASQLARSRLSF